MPELPQEWLKLLPVAGERERLAHVTRSYLAADTLKLEPMFIDFQLNWELEKWVSDSADRYQSSSEEVIEIAVQLGRYLQLVYPRSETPGVPYLYAIIPVDYLVSRMTVADQRAAYFSVWQKSHLAKLKTALEKKLGPIVFDDESAAGGTPRTPSVRPLQPIDDLLPRERSRREGYLHSQALAGDLIHFLFEMGLKRKQRPDFLLKEIVQVAHYIDVNFLDRNLPTLREQLLVKTMSAEKLALRLDRVLSTLETVLVDLEVSAKAFSKTTLTLAPI